MKNKIVGIVCLLVSVGFCAQTKTAVAKNEKQAIEHFEKNYKKKKYSKFEGKITPLDKQFSFDDKIAYVEKADKLTKSILSEGLFYPQLLTDYQMDKFMRESTDKSQKTYLKLQKNPKASFDVNKINVKITDLQIDLDNEKTKRYKVVTKATNIPSVRYYIELTNNKATKETKIEDFLKNAKLTYLQQE